MKNLFKYSKNGNQKWRIQIQNWSEVNSDEPHWIEDFEDHISPKRRPIEDLKLIEF